MKRLLWSIMLAALAVAPCAVQSSPMSMSMNGVGPRGFDWMVGAWSCINSMPSKSGGPRSQMLTVVRTNGGGIFFRVIAANFDNSWYAVYVPRTKTWLNPFIVSDGSYGSESTTQTGKRIVWTGSAFDASGKSTPVRDTVVSSSTTYTDLGESQSGGRWKAQYNLTCTKTS